MARGRAPGGQVADLGGQEAPGLDEQAANGPWRLSECREPRSDRAVRGDFELRRGRNMAKP